MERNIANTKLEKFYKIISILFISSIPMMPIYTIGIHYILGFLCMLCYFINIIHKKKINKLTGFEIAYTILIIYALFRVDKILAEKYEDYLSYGYYMVKNMLFNFVSIVCAIRLLNSTTKNIKETIITIGKTFVISTIIVSIYTIVYEYLILHSTARLATHVFTGRYGERMTFTHNITISLLFITYQMLNIAETGKRKPIKEGSILVFLLIISVLTGTRKLFLVPILFVIFYLLIGKKITFKSAIKYGLILLVIAIIGIYAVMKIDFLYDLFGHRIDSFIMEIIGEARDPSSSQRDRMITRGLIYIENHPIIGIGTDGFKFEFRENTGVFKYAHNNFIEMLADYGIIGFLLYYAWMPIAISKLFRAYKNKKENINLFFIGTMLTIVILDYWTVSYYRIHFLMILLLATYQSIGDFDNEKGIKEILGEIKKKIQKIIGKENIVKFKGYIKYIKVLPFIMKNKKISFNMEAINDIKVYELNNKNVFCGYYDLNPIKNEKMLVHVNNRNDITSKNVAEIGYFNIETNEYNKITNTKTWSWQQGSRLRWSEKENNVIFFNDIEDERYCLKKYDIVKNEVIDVISFPIYDMNKEENLGISINFSRLQRLRPGYGYDVLKDDTKEDNAPKTEGVFLVDMKNKTRKLLISLYDLAEMVDEDLKYEHYINHISISPTGEKMMFFHLWTEKEWTGWRTQLCVMDINGENFEVLEKEDVVSHYDWKDDNTILITGIKKADKTNFYREYNIKENTKKELENKNLKRDGHPTYIQNGKAFYSDTYPDNHCMQKVFLYSVEKDEYTKLLQVFSDPRLAYEKRCDLHPKIVNEKTILIDTTYKKYKRSVILMKLK